MLRNFLVFLVSVLVGLSCSAYEAVVTKDGYLLDRRGQLEGDYIRPPHPENIPSSPHLGQDLTDFSTYYDVNIIGKRRADNMEPIISGYNWNVSTRLIKSYTKQQYVDVWCDGTQHVGKIDCLTQDYAVSFFPVNNWSTAITRAALRARKVPQKGVAFLYVEDLATMSKDVHEAKDWADLWGVSVMFGTIDGGVPIEWIN